MYISIYIVKKERNVLEFFCKRMEHSRILFRSLQKNDAFFAIFSVLCKRTLHSLRSSGSHKLPKAKTLEKKGTFFFKNRKECNEPNGKERSAQPWNIGHICIIMYNMLGNELTLWIGVIFIMRRLG